MAPSLLDHTIKATSIPPMDLQRRSRCPADFERYFQPSYTEQHPLDRSNARPKINPGGNAKAQSS